MADAPEILKDEKLRDSYPKLNAAIRNSNEALSTANTAKTNADNAVTTANAANAKSDDTQQQLNNIVINNGQSDAEVLQARGTYAVLNDRLNDTDAQLADIPTQSYITDKAKQSDLDNVSKVTQNLINVRQPPYNVKGDGTDELSIIQQAIDDAFNGGYSGVYFPKPPVIYSVSDTLKGYSKQVYLGDGRGLSVIEQKTTDNPVFASKNYYDGTSPTGRLVIKGLSFKGNTSLPNNHGLLIRDYAFVLEDFLVSGVGGDGVQITHKDINGISVSGTLVENHISRYEIRDAGNYGLFIGETDNNKLTDSWLTNGIIEGSTNSHLFIGSAGGWKIDGLHTYGSSPLKALEINNCYHTFVDNIYIEGFTQRAINFAKIQRHLMINNITVKCDNANDPSVDTILFDRNTLVTETQVAANNITLYQNTNFAIDGIRCVSGSIHLRISNYIIGGTYKNQVRPFDHPSQQNLSYTDVLKGTTAERPTNAVRGQQYFDTDLGKLIYFNVNTWKDGAGTVV